MAEYYLAPSLAALRREINGRWPNRDTASDGWIGDPSHQARKSDHNPDYSAGGVVRAIDVDKDGINVTELLAAVVRDPRVAYVIWNRRIASATDDGVPWDWEPYDGDNPHDKHVHISIKHASLAETNTAAWFPVAPTKEDDMQLTDVIPGLKDRDGRPVTVGQALSRAAWAYDQIRDGGSIDKRLEAEEREGSS